MDNQVAGNTKRVVRRLLQDIVLLVVAISCFIGWSTVTTAYGSSLMGSTVTDRGVAVARNCEFDGTFGIRALGWWTCTADVRWDNAGRADVVFHDSQLTAEDVGNEVDVVQRRIPKGAGKGANEAPYRADFEPRPMMGNILGIPMFAVGILILFSIAFRLWQTAKRSFGGNR